MQQTNFITIPAAVLARGDLSLAEKAILGRAVGFAINGRHFYESAEHLANLLGISVKTVHRAKQHLEALSLIICVANNGRGKVYEVNTGEVLEPSQPLTMEHAEVLQGGSDVEGGKSIISPAKVAQNGSKSLTRAKAIDPQARAEAEHLQNCISKNNPAYRRREADLDKWAVELERMHRIDGRSWGEIRQMAEWATTHDFWGANILSAKKLRQHYATMARQVKFEFMRRGVVDLNKISDEDLADPFA